MKRLVSEWDDDKQRIAALHGTVVAAQHDGAGSAGVDRSGARVRVEVNDSNFLSGGDGFGQGDLWFEVAGMRRWVMNLQMGFLGVGRQVEGLRRQRRQGFADAPNLAQQVVQATVERGEVALAHGSRSVAFRVDRRDIVVEGGAEGATGKVGAGPTPECVEARGHGALRGIDQIVAPDDVSNPWMQGQSVPSAVQIDVVGDVAEQLGFEKVGELGGGRTVSASGKCAGEVFGIGGVASLTSGEGGFVEDGNENDRAVEIGRVPSVDPLVEQGRSFVFVTVGGTIDEQDGTGGTAPDVRVESESCVAKTMAMLPVGQGSQIQRRRTRRNFLHD